MVSVKISHSKNNIIIPYQVNDVESLKKKILKVANEEYVFQKKLEFIMGSLVKFWKKDKDDISNNIKKARTKAYKKMKKVYFWTWANE